MGNLLGLLILYILFTVISSTFKKATKASKVSQPKKNVEQEFQSKVEQYFGNIEDYLRKTPQVASTTPPPLPSQASPKPQQPTRLELYPSQPQAQPVTKPPVVKTAKVKKPSKTRKTGPSQPHVIPISELELSISKDSVASKRSFLLPFARREGVLQGIVMTEILGKPVSKRPRATGRRG